MCTEIHLFDVDGKKKPERERDRESQECFYYYLCSVAEFKCKKDDEKRKKIIPSNYPTKQISMNEWIEFEWT